MTLIHWNPSLEVGHPTIDADHQTLIDLVNKLGDPILSVALALAIFDELVAHAAAHFGREEELMRTIAYADYPKHCKEHLHMAEDLSERRHELASGTITGTEVGRFIRQWFMTHALFSDQSLANAFMRKTSERQSA